MHVYRQVLRQFFKTHANQLRTGYSPVRASYVLDTYLPQTNARRTTPAFKKTHSVVREEGSTQAPMNFHNATFRAAYGMARQLPASTLPEISFAGRSNVGKSSLLNKLMYRKDLAKVSSTPGKTATINFYEVDACHFVDLPGYGFAKVAKSEKHRWGELIEGYFNQERMFCLVVCLVDIRHDASSLDINMLHFLQAKGLDYAVVFTKADKLSKQQCAKQLAALRRQLHLDTTVETLAVSSANGTGIAELRTLIGNASQAYTQK